MSGVGYQKDSPPEGDAGPVQTLVDFLAFRNILSPAVLPVIYVLGAAGIPFGMWPAVKRSLPFLEKQVPGPHRSGAENAPVSGYNGRILSWFALLFVITEILRRILFEYLVAFLQMREAFLFLVNGHKMPGERRSKNFLFRQKKREDK